MNDPRSALGMPEWNGLCSLCGGDVWTLPPTPARMVLLISGAPDDDLLELQHAPDAFVTWCEPCGVPTLLYPKLEAV